MVTTFATATASVSLAPAAALGAATSLDLVFSKNTAKRVGIDVELSTSAVEVGGRARFAFDTHLSSGAAKLILVPLGSTEFEPVELALPNGPSEVQWAPSAIGTVTHLELNLEIYHLGLAPQRRTTVTRLKQGLSCLPATERGPSSGLATSAAVRLRQYSPGDRPSRIDWRATARTGQLHSRVAAPASEEVTVVVDLGPEELPAPVRTACLQTAANVGRQALRDGQLVRLVNREVSESSSAQWPHGGETLVVNQLCSERQLLRRLARATYGQSIPQPPDAVVLSADSLRRHGTLT